ncbi:uncharacterized protein LOC134774787 [Penaeus indicus]|uniref:uncharacterized protein LOC134774787 n=1 Tax=Penaeus indicus TaxID=29960 RepID=UPI00300CBCCD
MGFPKGRSPNRFPTTADTTVIDLPDNIEMKPHFSQHHNLRQKPSLRSATEPRKNNLYNRFPSSSQPQPPESQVQTTEIKSSPQNNQNFSQDAVTLLTYTRTTRQNRPNTTGLVGVRVWAGHGAHLHPSYPTCSVPSRKQGGGYYDLQPRHLCPPKVVKCDKGSSSKFIKTKCVPNTTAGHPGDSRHCYRARFYGLAVKVTGVGGCRLRPQHNSQSVGNFPHPLRLPVAININTDFRLPCPRTSTHPRRWRDTLSTATNLASHNVGFCFLPLLSWRTETRDRFVLPYPAGVREIATSSLPHSPHIVRLKALKRQQRMIKNRESASLSRKKKKEYVTALEGNITELQNENKRLKEDNIRLQQKVSSLESECASLRHALGRSPSRKTTTALFAIIFLLSLNLGPLTGIFLSNESRLSSLKRMMQGVEPSSLGTGFKHRSLLWADEKQASAEEGTIPNLNTNTSSMCPMYINATESLRLETELRGWFENKMDKKKNNNNNQRPLLSHPKTREGRNRLNKHKNAGEPSQKLSKQVGSEVWNALVPPQQPSNKPAPLYHYVHYVEPSTSTEEDTSVMATVPRLTSFLEAIQRRDDTYYVVSFSPDHLLVPATARNDSARPRMSLLMPTPQSMNDSLAPPPNNVALMQIDCEVMHTRLVHVAQELVPPYLRTDRSNTSRTSSEEATTATPRERRNSRSRPRHTLTKPAFPHK